MKYDDIYKYLRDKIIRTNPNNSKSNWGARLLNIHMDIDNLDDYIISAIDDIQRHFATDSGDHNVKGQANLTRLSVNIGNDVLTDIGLSGEGKPWLVDQIRTGDLFIEAFVALGYLTIHRPKTIDDCYVVKITLKWVELLRTTQRSLTSLVYTDTEPYEDGCKIKGEVGKRLQNVTWRRAATQLMTTPWTINAPVLEAVIKNKDMFVSDVPIEWAVALDGKPDPYLQREEQRRMSRLADFYMVTAKATALRDKVFYQEVEADYRGRLYYKEDFLNFQGSDTARGLYLFAEGKPMTEEGKWWLAIHTAGSYNMSYSIDDIPEWCGDDYKSYLESEGLDSISVDKFTLEDRVRWTNEYMETIIHAGEHKLIADEAEKKITFLACCVEWNEIQKAEDKGEQYISRLPISIDGSNNGWQHLGAISKDRRTGELVGMVATRIPKDFYVQTAKKLTEIDDPILNSMPMKHIRKGISKRGSMTRAYSAGADKIGENMWFDCQSEEFDKRYDITKDDCMRWAKDLIKAIEKVCPGPLSTMKYMQDLAVFHIGKYTKYRDGKAAVDEYSEVQKELKDLWTLRSERRKEELDLSDEEHERIVELIDESKEFYSVLTKGNGAKYIEWTTPSRFPVKYEAYKEDKFKCRGTLNGKQIKHVLRIQTEIPDVRKYMCGISPNFIHSQDASHMAMVIDEFNGTFGAIHDSFSTHASDVEDILAITKDTFVKMYDNKNVFEDIRNNITGGTDDVDQPPLGSLEIQEVYDSDYFFS